MVLTKFAQCNGLGLQLQILILNKLLHRDRTYLLMEDARRDSETAFAADTMQRVKVGGDKYRQTTNTSCYALSQMASLQGPPILQHII